MADGDRLTLRQAINEDRLPEFVAQAEVEGTPTAELEAFDKVVRAAVKPAKVSRSKHRVSELPVVRPIAELSEVRRASASR